MLGRGRRWKANSYQFEPSAQGRRIVGHRKEVSFGHFLIAERPKWPDGGRRDAAVRTKHLPAIRSTVQLAVAIIAECREFHAKVSDGGNEEKHEAQESQHHRIVGDGERSEKLLITVPVPPPNGPPRKDREKAPENHCPGECETHKAKSLKPILGKGHKEEHGAAELGRRKDTPVELKAGELPKIGGNGLQWCRRETPVDKERHEEKNNHSKQVREQQSWSVRAKSRHDRIRFMAQGGVEMERREEVRGSGGGDGEERNDGR